MSQVLFMPLGEERPFEEGTMRLIRHKYRIPSAVLHGNASQPIYGALLLEPAPAPCA